MWIEQIALENIKCFDSINISFKKHKDRAQWVTLLSENGSGKTSVLQAIAVMLAGPDAGGQLVPRPAGWLKDESKPGKISARIHQDPGDSGTFGVDKVRTTFGFSSHVTGSMPLSIRGKSYSEPGIHESADKALSWLRQNAFSPQSKGWFAVGYGAFRRLTRNSQVIVPSLQTPSRYSNFITQFQEDEGLASFERWMIYLDYREAKENDANARRRREMGVAAINELLPQGVRFNTIDGDGKIIFDVQGSKVPTIALSDGYRSVLALAGDLVWRLMSSFPESSEPLKEKGVVLIDELDIHLHPRWQRHIAAWLQKQFPNLQFIVTTHSPMVAAGAGEHALTYKLTQDGAGALPVTHSLFAMDVDDILKSEAFGLISTYSPETQDKLDRFSILRAKLPKLSQEEGTEYAQLSLFVEEHNPYGVEKLASPLESEIDRFLAKKMKAAA